MWYFSEGLPHENSIINYTEDINFIENPSFVMNKLSLMFKYLEFKFMSFWWNTSTSTGGVIFHFIFNLCPDKNPLGFIPFIIHVWTKTGKWFGIIENLLTWLNLVELIIRLCGLVITFQNWNRTQLSGQKSAS